MRLKVKSVEEIQEPGKIWQIREIREVF